LKHVSIVGGGNVGTNTAFFVAENRAASVTLVDVREGITTGKALDLMEAAPIRGYDTRIQGSDRIEAIEGSDVVVIAAGRVRHPGEDRTDLYRDNSKTVGGICVQIRKLAPAALVINVVEPVDLLTLLAQETLGFDRFRVMGVGGLLSSTRILYLVSHAFGVSPREVTALVIGPHRRSMVFLRDSIRISGVPAAQLMDGATLDRLIEEARTAGDTILKLAQRSTSYYAPSAAAAALVQALVRDTHALLPVSVRCQGEYGVSDLAVGVPAMIGAGGVERVVEVALSDSEQQAFRAALDELAAARRQVSAAASGR
jgi:malate dehydrogenase